MGYLAEHTAVVKSTNKLDIINNPEVKFVNEIYEKNGITIFTFDAYSSMPVINNALIYEINMLDNEPLYTVVLSKKTGEYKDKRFRAKFYIKKLIGKDDFNSIINDLEYTDGRI